MALQIGSAPPAPGRRRRRPRRAFSGLIKLPVRAEELGGISRCETDSQTSRGRSSRMALVRLARGVLGPRLTGAQPASRSEIEPEALPADTDHLRGPRRWPRGVAFGPGFELVFQVVERRGAKLGCAVLLPNVDASRLPIVTHSPHHRCDDLISQGLDRRTRVIGAADERTDLDPVSLEQGGEEGRRDRIGDPAADPQTKRHSGRSGRGWATRPAGPGPVLRLAAICGGRPRFGGPAGSHRPPTA